ncbi:MAG: hypothetical protein ABGY72_13420 [bacterium]
MTEDDRVDGRDVEWEWRSIALVPLTPAMDEATVEKDPCAVALDQVGTIPSPRARRHEM